MLMLPHISDKCKTEKKNGIKPTATRAHACFPACYVIFWPFPALHRQKYPA